MTVAPGKIVGDKYRVIRQIGEGGMGTVFEVEHTFLDRRVALKVMNSDLAKDRLAVERFFQEAKAASAIGHPNIIEIFDIGQDEDGTVYFIMELLQGKSLEELLDKHEQLSTDRAVAIILQMLSALHYAHKKGIVHRDLKPANIFLAIDARGREEVKLLDFGIAKVKKPSEKDRRLTIPGMMVGTPRYASPEQIKGKEEIDHRVDLWAAGVLLYELIAGERPFEGESYSEVLSKILMENHTPLREALPKVSFQLSQIADKAMAKNPDERYQTAQEMIEDLSPFQGNALNTMSGTAARLIRTSFPPPAFVEETDSGTQRSGSERARTSDFAGDNALVDDAIRPDPKAKTPPADTMIPFSDTKLLDLDATTQNVQPETLEEARQPELVKKRSFRLRGVAIGGIVLLTALLVVLLWPEADPMDDDTEDTTDKIAEKGRAQEAEDPKPISDADASVEEKTPMEAATSADDAPVPAVKSAEETDEKTAADDAPVESSSAISPPLEVKNLNDVKQLLKDGKREAAISGLQKLRRDQPPPKKAHIVFMLANLYYKKKWLSVAFDHYREAIHLDGAYRKRNTVIRNLIEMMSARKLGVEVMYFLQKNVGRSAVPHLKRAAKRHKHPLVKKRAASILKKIGDR